MTLTLQLGDPEITLLHQLLEMERLDLHSEIRRAMVPHDDLQARLRLVERLLDRLSVASH